MADFPEWVSHSTKTNRPADYNVDSEFDQELDYSTGIQAEHVHSKLWLKFGKQTWRQQVLFINERIWMAMREITFLSNVNIEFY